MASDVGHSDGIVSPAVYGLTRKSMQDNGQPMSSTIFMPIASPPTPAPSPGIPSEYAFHHMVMPSGSPAQMRKEYLRAVLATCTPSELLFISTTIAPMLKRDFIRSLPQELSLHILGYVDDVKSLVCAGQVSRYWRIMSRDEGIWRGMCQKWGFDYEQELRANRSLARRNSGPHITRDNVQFNPSTWNPASQDTHVSLEPTRHPLYRTFFQDSYTIMDNWRKGGRLLRAHRSSYVPADGGVITSLALDDEWVVVGQANCRIHVFSARTGVMARTLTGHESGVWAVALVSRGGQMASNHVTSDDTMSGVEGPPGTYRTALGLDIPPESMEYETNISKQSEVSGASEGWGQPNAIGVSGGCDKVLRVHDLVSGYCIYALAGHTSTIRCIKVLHNRPVAVSGSRDSTVRVWDIQHGRQLRVLAGHTDSVRALDVCGNKLVSGSYDTTCRLWDIDTGECLHVLRGHFHQIYSVAFDGIRIASGGLDTTVRVWDPETGVCLALLQGHTALVCQLQLSSSILATGGSDGRVITFSLSNSNTTALTSGNAYPTTSSYSPLSKIAAHDSSVTSLQFDSTYNLLVTGGNDGRCRLFDLKTGEPINDMTEPCESVWKVGYDRRRRVCAIMCRRLGKTVMEIWSFRGRGEQRAVAMA